MWKVENPVAQPVNIGISGAMNRQFSPRWGCKTGANLESFWYTFNSDKGSRLKDSNLRWYKWSSSNDAFTFDSLAAGTYYLTVGGGATKPRYTGEMPFAVISRSGTQSVKVSKN